MEPLKPNGAQDDDVTLNDLLALYQSANDAAPAFPAEPALPPAFPPSRAPAATLAPPSAAATHDADPELSQLLAAFQQENAAAPAFAPAPAPFPDLAPLPAMEATVPIAGDLPPFAIPPAPADASPFGVPDMGLPPFADPLPPLDLPAFADTPVAGFGDGQIPAFDDTPFPAFPGEAAPPESVLPPASPPAPAPQAAAPTPAPVPAPAPVPPALELPPLDPPGFEDAPDLAPPSIVAMEQTLEATMRSLEIPPPMAPLLAGEPQVLPPLPPRLPNLPLDATLRHREVPLEVTGSSRQPMSQALTVPGEFSLATAEERQSLNQQLAVALQNLDTGLDSVLDQMSELYQRLSVAASHRAPVSEIMETTERLTRVKGQVGENSALWQQAQFLRNAAEAYMRFLESV